MDLSKDAEGEAIDLVKQNTKKLIMLVCNACKHKKRYHNFYDFIRDLNPCVCGNLGPDMFL